MAHTVKLTPQSDQLLQSLAFTTGEKKTIIIELALRDFEAKMAMAALNRDYARLRQDSKAWEEELEERKTLEGVDYNEE